MQRKTPNTEQYREARTSPASTQSQPNLSQPYHVIPHQQHAAMMTGQFSYPTHQRQIQPLMSYPINQMHPAAPAMQPSTAYGHMPNQFGGYCGQGPLLPAPYTLAGGARGQPAPQPQQQSSPLPVSIHSHDVIV